VLILVSTAPSGLRILKSAHIERLELVVRVLVAASAKDGKPVDPYMVDLATFLEAAAVSASEQERAGVSTETGDGSVGAYGGRDDELTVSEAAALKRVHPQTIYRHVRSGRLNNVGLGRTIRIPREELNR
jgi:excisionase family DNA binding protein